MSDLRRRIHDAVVVDDGSELDIEALQHRVVRRRHRRAAAVGAAAVVVVLAAGGGVLAAQHGSDAGSLRTHSGSSEPTVPTTEPESSTTTTDSTGPNTTVAPPGTGSTQPPSGAGSWQASPTTGLANFDDVTITAGGLPAGSYDVAQCPAAAARAGDESKCLLNTIVNVTDGRLTARVRAFWWMASGQIDCGAAPGTCLVGVQNTSPKSPFVPVTFDLSFDPAKRPRIEVAPSTDLTDGQQIEVRGINVGAGSVSFSECLQDQWATCQYAAATAGADRNFTTTFPVQRVLHWGFHGNVDQTSECGVDGPCVIEVWVTPNGFENFDTTVYRVWIEPTHPVALAFAPAPPPPTTTTTTTTAP